MGRLTLVALTALAWLAITATAARAATVFIHEGLLEFVGETGENNRVTISRDGDAYRVTDAFPITSDDCARPEPSTALCPIEGVTALGIALNDGDDELTVATAIPGGLNGGPGADLIIAGDGADFIYPGPGSDTVRAGGGDDQILENDSDSNVFDGGEGADLIIGGNGPDVITGGPGDDRNLYGHFGDDLVDGGAGDDLLDGGPGPQGLVTDVDRVIGGEGTDTASHLVHFGPIRVSLGDGPGDGAPGERDDVAGDIERLIGSQGADELIGTPRSDSIDGAGGADVIDGGEGDDVLDGGADGAGDTLRGAAGRDRLTGGAGGDALEGGDGNDDVDGGGDADSLSGGPGEDELKAGDGDDRLEGGAGPDELNGGPGTDTVRYVSTSPVQVTLDGEDNDGAVTLSDEGRSRVEEGARSEGDNVDATNERVDGSRVDDTVSGDADPNELTGAAGEDYLDGQSGADVLSGGGRNDTIMARDRGRDRVSCGAGYDYVVADRADVIGDSARCEYVDDDSTARPAALRDIKINPRCKRGKDADLSPPGTRRAVPVKEAVRVPTRSRVDSYDCEVVLEAAVGGGETETGTLGARTGTMEVTQRRTADGRVLTKMRSTDCKLPARSSGMTAHVARYRIAKYRRRYGRFGIPVELRLDAAIVRTRRGVATWEVDDRCGRSATVRVTSGRLTVVDLGTDRTVVLGPGEKHTARLR